MSKFMEVNTIKGSKVLINIDKILAVYCENDGNCSILFDEDCYYEVEDYEKIKAMLKIMEVSK